MKIKKGDTIIVTGGKDRGRTGKVEQVLPKEAAVLVAGLNMYKRHLKKRDEKHPGGIIDFPMPLPIARVALVCSQCGKPTRVGYIVAKGEKVRICKKCKQNV